LRDAGGSDELGGAQSQDAGTHRPLRHTGYQRLARASAIGAYLSVQLSPVQVRSSTPPLLDPGMHAVAVELDLVQPSLAVGCRPHQCGQRRGVKAERCGGVWSSFVTRRASRSVTRRASRSADSVHPLLNSGSDIRDADCPARKPRLGTIPKRGSLGLHDSLPDSARIAHRVLGPRGC
jgi:hypothetical protein